MRLNLTDESVVVVPSISIERTTAASGTVMQAMEERALFLLLLLRQPRLRMIYVTSHADLRSDRGVLPRAAPRGDPQPCPRPADPGPGRRCVTASLSSKLLARPRLLREIRSLIPNPARAT